jgi:hypothetical protein
MNKEGLIRKIKEYETLTFQGNSEQLIKRFI